MTNITEIQTAAHEVLVSAPWSDFDATPLAASAFGLNTLD